MSNLDTQNNNWYAPLEEPKKAPEKKERKRLSTRKKIFLGVLGLLAMISISSILFSSKEGDSAQGPGVGAPAPDAGNELPGDWREFFDSYFEPAESSKKETRIPRAKDVPAFELALEKPGEQELSLQELYRQCTPSIVSITGYVNGRGGYYWGTGIILSEDGLILTNAHLMEDCDSAVVALNDDRSFEARLVGSDHSSDIAVLKIEAEGLTPAVFGDSEALAVGEHVAAIGNPLGEGFRLTLTDGIVSAIDRNVNYDGHTVTLLQTNTAINDGNSGGALFNMYGQVVGVTNMKMVSSYISIEGISFAIPSSTVRSMVNALVRDGEVRGRTALGVTVGAIPDNLAEHYKLPAGLYVSHVEKNTDAAEKGLKTGDIITHVNGKEARSTNDILLAKEGLSVGDTIRFTVWRDGESFELDVALVEYNDIY